jgi:hypothetical protein
MFVGGLVASHGGGQLQSGQCWSGRHLSGHLQGQASWVRAAVEGFGTGGRWDGKTQPRCPGTTVLPTPRNGWTQQRCWRRHFGLIDQI